MKGQTCSLSVTLVVTLLSVLVNGQTSTLTCKKCDRVASLDSCTGSQKCADNEICYMDELITDQLTVVYTGGCRSTVVCNSGVGGSPSVGRRGLQKRSDLVACSRCCDIKKKSGELDCNARLCGIKYTNTNSTRCYLCDNLKGDAEQGDVDIPEDCLSETTCQPNEACGAERLDFSGKNSHKYTCLPKRICTLLTKEALKRKDECLTNPDPNICGNVGAGKRAATNQCTACCGDGLCNSGSCEQVLDRLYNLWKGGALDFDTLRQKGTPTTTAPPPTKPSTAATQKTTTQPPPPTKPPTTQPPVVTTQTTQPPVVTTQTTQPPVVTTQTTQPPVVTTQTTQPPVVTTQTTQPPVVTTQTTQPPVVTTQTTQPPVVTTQTTQPPVVTTQTTQPPVVTTQTTQPPVVTTKTTQPPVVTTQTTQPPVVTTKTTQPPVVTTQTTQPPVVTTQTTQPSPPTLAGSTAPQTPATAAVVVSQATSTLAPNSPPTVTPNTVVPPNTTSIIG